MYITITLQYTLQLHYNVHYNYITMYITITLKCTLQLHYNYITMYTTITLQLHYNVHYNYITMYITMYITITLQLHYNVYYWKRISPVFQGDLTIISELTPKSLLPQNAKSHLIKYSTRSDFPTCFVQIRKIPGREEKIPRTSVTGDGFRSSQTRILS
jgi:hypothetical protein